MSLALYMDENVPDAITEGLRSRKVDVLTVQEDGLAGYSDRIIFARAIELKRIIFSQDQDFLVKAKEYQQEGLYFPGVIYARQMRVSVGTCVRDLELVANAGEKTDFANKVVYLPL
ncbi:MAG: DUF5615 family PIN-like protein [Cyanobacteria bacterium SBLK]|nr:DUF5615 family PIN-like protein [Cyanobacteria bacterium SBLK]